MKVAKIHMVTDEGTVLCNAKKANSTTSNNDEVTCKLCLKKIVAIAIVEAVETIAVETVDETVPASFEVWFNWDKGVYSWIGQSLDSEGNQIGEAVYEYYKTNCMKAVMATRDEIDDEVPILIETAGHTKNDPTPKKYSIR